MSARSCRALANLEKRIQKFIDTAFLWPVEVGKILMRLLIVILNKLVRIISRRNRLVSKIALGDHLVGWSSIRGSIFRGIGYDQGGYSLFLTRARARGVRWYFWHSGSFRRRAGCGRWFCDFRKRFLFCADRKGFDTIICRRSSRVAQYLQNCKIRWYSRERVKGSFPYLKCKYDAIWSHMDSHGPAWVFIILSILCRKRVWIEVELLLQNRPPLFLWSLIWTGWKPRFHRFFEVFKERKDALIVCAVSTPPLFFFGNCRKKDFNCLRSIGSPVFLLWKCLISGERCIFSRIVTSFKERKVSRFLFAISTASLYAAENDYVFGSRRRPYERS